MIGSTSQIILFVKDKEEAKAFYTEKLGFIIRDEEQFTEDWSYLTVAPQSNNEVVIELLEAVTTEEKQLVGRQAAEQVFLMFKVDDINNTYQNLKSRGVKFHGEPSEVPGGKGVGFEDLYGNKLDLFEEGKS
ncbi:glyoxalase [Gracilibacillus salitolerans]|uniref:Glyoxalase n=1 Tax=Gracilibacillus salitolerans TaxID=2663022 RepID=A0A5Q2TLD1_9BACI|nr:VOC family protein [Gracilibacillus salitolerans]QGH34680.1 glyoxalase [Gracilibacillus salitolerans]